MSREPDIVTVSVPLQALERGPLTFTATPNAPEPSPETLPSNPPPPEEPEA